MPSHRQVCHNWVAGKRTGTKGFNMFYDGPTIFSYGRHFPAAHKMDNGFYLVRSDHPSVSTAKHLGHIWHAICRAGLHDRMFRVPFVVPWQEDRLGVRYEWEDIHRANYGYILAQADKEDERAKRARKYKTSRAPEMRDKAQRYFDTFIQKGD